MAAWDAASPTSAVRDRVGYSELKDMIIRYWMRQQSTYEGKAKEWEDFYSEKRKGPQLHPLRAAGNAYCGGGTHVRANGQ